MEGRQTTQVSAQISAAFAWWREAGVDYDFADDPAAWLASAEPEAALSTERQATQPAMAASRAKPEAEKTPADFGGDAAAWPQELSHFGPWWLSESTLGADALAGRVPPRGPANAPLMILVEQPEAGDAPGPAGHLLGGPEGALLAAVLQAIGFTPDQAYVASVLPAPSPLAPWDDLARAGLGKVLRHHVTLAGPQRLIAFGANIPPLLGHDPAQSDQNLPLVDQEGRTIPVLFARSLAALSRPRAKVGFWQSWLDWTRN